ncbi:helix-turn-helix transcriptional regulator [Hydrogenophaga sp. D2P1]|jgi:DNA-binding CsgD family transcriptional regulator|uniref:Helix-turn-helix transcriptional regulator n=1 Tax=Hydrogenophaga aromaticivorans TaxID=2610898 RepID=A0A7Y8L0Z6_9BURK|nr:helix-turn-helix transcriptional regulator [Hydrogenophaga aromaticivorans]NWF48886.1 helix-turn-helix transcriptional regulator [Hydrogenophaga aromaticivorans]
MWQANETISTRSHFSAAGFGAQGGLEQALLLRVLDEVDYGVLVIDGQGRLRHANHLARHEMISARLIMNHGNTLLGVTTDFTVQIQQALEQALRGQRRLVSLRSASRELSLAFIPLSHPLETDEPSVLVLLSRQSACENLAVRMFARSQNLSPSEESVLMGLCRGLSIPDIAAEHGVVQSTVRSQIKALREKTGCPSIRLMMQRVNSLPPVVPALRIVSPMPHNAMEFAQP